MHLAPVPAKRSRLFEMLRGQNVSHNNECAVDRETKALLEAMETKLCMLQALRSWERPEPIPVEAPRPSPSAAKSGRYYEFLRTVRP